MIRVLRTELLLMPNLLNRVILTLRHNLQIMVSNVELVLQVLLYFIQVYFRFLLLLRNCKLSVAILRCSWFFTTRRGVLVFLRFFFYRKYYSFRRCFNLKAKVRKIAV